MTLVEWLGKDPRITYAMACRVTIGNKIKTTHEAAMYKMKNFGTRIAVIGDLPNSYKRTSNTIYQTNDQRWFIVGFYNRESLMKQNRPLANQETQPFGDVFYLGHWEDAISENKPRVVPMTIEFT